MFAVGFTAILM